MNQLPLLSTRRGRITLVLVAVVLMVIALVGIILVVSVARRYSLVAAGALITAWPTLLSVGITQLVGTWLATERARVDSQQAAERAQFEAQQAAERAQVEALQNYLKEMGALLSDNPDVRYQASTDNDDLRTLARAHTLTVLSNLNPARQQLVINYLREVHLLHALQLHHPSIENQLAEAEPELAEQRAQDEALQAYLDQMRSLERDLRESEAFSEVQTLAALRTLTVLPRLDRRRKTALMRFLVEAALIQGVEGREPNIRLTVANLYGANLSGANLYGANLTGTYLSNANLVEAYLDGANLHGAYMTGVDLEGANLGGATLINANLSNAYLAGADLSYATGITNEELEQQAASLKGATMPNGQKYEDWLKDREPPEG